MILSASLPNRQSPHEKAGKRLTNSDDQDLENRTRIERIVRIVALCCRRVRLKASHVGKRYRQIPSLNMFSCAFICWLLMLPFACSFQ